MTEVTPPAGLDISAPVLVPYLVTREAAKCFQLLDRPQACTRVSDSVGYAFVVIADSPNGEVVAVTNPPTSTSPVPGAGFGERPGSPGAAGARRAGTGPRAPRPSPLASPSAVRLIPPPGGRTAGPRRAGSVAPGALRLPVGCGPAISLLLARWRWSGARIVASETSGMCLSIGTHEASGGPRRCAGIAPRVRMGWPAASSGLSADGRRPRRDRLPSMLQSAALMPPGAPGRGSPLRSSRALPAVSRPPRVSGLLGRARESPVRRVRLMHVERGCRWLHQRDRAAPPDGGRGSC